MSRQEDQTHPRPPPRSQAQCSTSTANSQTASKHIKSGQSIWKAIESNEMEREKKKMES